MEQVFAPNLQQFFLAPALAHEVQVAGDVAGTWHVEPNHQPKSGEPAQIWVALTKQGGEIVPLAAANCQMSIFRQPQTAADAPIASPTLKAINVEKYQGIPSAEVIFPQVGLYKVDLNCTPKNPADFRPFQMQYSITVAAGRTPDPTPVPMPEPISRVSPGLSPASANPILIAAGLSGILGLALAVIVFRLKR